MNPRRGTNEQILSGLKAEHNLTTDQVAALARVSVHTAHAWGKPETSSSHRRIPDGSLELIFLKLGLGTPFRA